MPDRRSELESGKISVLTRKCGVTDAENVEVLNVYTKICTKSPGHYQCPADDICVLHTNLYANDSFIAYFDSLDLRMQCIFAHETGRNQ